MGRVALPLRLQGPGLSPSCLWWLRPHHPHLCLLFWVSLLSGSGKTPVSDLGPTWVNESELILRSLTNHIWEDPFSK